VPSGLARPKKQHCRRARRLCPEPAAKRLLPIFDATFRPSGKLH
jgi:hypothetical protein